MDPHARDEYVRQQCRRGGGRPLDLSKYLDKDFGSWHVVAYLGYRPRYEGAPLRCSWFRARCVCGHESDLTIVQLRGNRSLQCLGCAAFKAKIRHGLTAQKRRRLLYGFEQDRNGDRTKFLYHLYANMLRNARRDENEVQPSWLGKGGFDAFVADMKPPKHGRVWIVRIDPSRGWYADNMRFRFVRHQKTYSIDGVPYTAGEIEFLYGINRNTFKHRVEKIGMTVRNALRCSVARTGRQKVEFPDRAPRASQ